MFYCPGHARTHTALSNLSSTRLTLCVPPCREPDTRAGRSETSWGTVQDQESKTQEAAGRFSTLRAGDLHVVLELGEGRKGGKGQRKYQAAYLNLKFFILEKKKCTSGIHSPQKPAANQLLSRTAPTTTMMIKWGRCLMEG